MTPVPMSDLSDLENANKRRKNTERRRKKEEKKKKKKKATKSGFELATCIFHTFFRIIFFPTFLSLDELLMFVFTPFSPFGSCGLGSLWDLFLEKTRCAIPSLSWALRVLFSWCTPVLVASIFPISGHACLFDDV